MLVVDDDHSIGDGDSSRLSRATCLGPPLELGMCLLILTTHPGGWHLPPFYEWGKPRSTGVKLLQVVTQLVNGGLSHALPLSSPVAPRPCWECEEGEGDCWT